MRVCTLCHQKVPAGLSVCPRDGAPAVDAHAREGSLVGTNVGEYLLKRLIGEGGMGQVFEGLQPLIGKRVAIKLLRRELAHDPGEAQRLLTEARAVNAIGHRGIIDIFGFGALPDGRQYVVMEYLSGQPLSRYLRKFAPLPVDDALELIDETLAAVGAAHGAGVIHRDLKPSNIFLVAQGDGSHFVKVLDFGLAKKAAVPHGETPQTRVSRVLGTPEYMAPEQARAEAVGPRTDLYALGCVLFEMLTGRPPFEAPTPFEIVNMHLNAPVPAPSKRARGVPAEVDELVRWLMQKDATARPESAELVRAEVRRLRRRLKLESTHLSNQVSSVSASSVQPAPESPSAELTRTEPEARLVSDDTGRYSDTTLTPLEPDEPSEPSEPKETRILPPSRLPQTRARAGETTESNVSEVTSLTGRRRGPAIAVVAVAFLLLGGLVSYLLRPRASTGTGAPGASPASKSTAGGSPTSRSPQRDALNARYERARAAWARARAGLTPEDRRGFDLMLEQVGQLLATGALGQASERLDDFVAGALQGREP